jgi:uncharacterized protein
MSTLHNIYFFIPFIVWAFAQIVKVMIDSYCGKKITFRSLLSSWGMPSAHSTLTSSLVTMVILFEWLFSTITMIVSVFSVLIRYDAANVRYESWKHAQYINTLRDEMHKVMTHEHLSEKPHFLGFGLLRERLWHTPVEISIWILFWVFVTIGFVLLCDMYIISF